jgi:hypothetical protein
MTHCTALDDGHGRLSNVPSGFKHEMITRTSTVLRSLLQAAVTCSAHELLEVYRSAETEHRIIHEHHHIKKCVHDVFQRRWLKCKLPSHLCYIPTLATKIHCLFHQISTENHIFMWLCMLCCASMTQTTEYKKAKLKLVNYFKNIKHYRISLT